MVRLALTILIHPKTVKQLGADFESALTDLHYGSIGVNIWNASAFMLVQATWGAFPGSTTDNIQSGFGIVGNSFMFEKPERTVMRGSILPVPALLAARRPGLPAQAALVPHQQDRPHHHARGCEDHHRIPSGVTCRASSGLH